MASVIRSAALGRGAILWRYLSMDKLVDLLATAELHFTPLVAFAETDPFEGFMPAVAMTACASLLHPLVAEAESAATELRSRRRSDGNPLTEEEDERLASEIASLRGYFRRLLPTIARTTAVNCWHANESESEAMWRLYSENGKCVAIQSTIERLAGSFTTDVNTHEVHISPVKYINFFDETPSYLDRDIEGFQAPLFKRMEYSHEREVRAFIPKLAPDIAAASDPSFWRAQPLRIAVDLELLIERVYVCPYAREPFPKSVRQLLDQFGLREKIVKCSGLLSGQEILLDCLLP